MGILKYIFRPIMTGSAAGKGKLGECLVNDKLNPLFFGKVNHRQINDLVLIDDLGKTHQIDHIEIRQNGIFCIETKNYNGWIFGGEKQDYWTQTLFKKKHKFLSPIKQNKSHIYHLNKALNGKYKINSLVVMVQDNANRINVPYVVNLCDLKEYLKNFNDGTCYTIEEMDEIYNLIKSCHRTDISKRQHVKNIRQTEVDIEKGICPRCGYALVQKEGKYGVFIGCSNYPECKFILK